MRGGYSDEYASSDELGDILEMSRIEYESNNATLSRPSVPNPSGPLHLGTRVLRSNLAEIDAEVSRYKKEIKGIEALIALRMDERSKILEELGAATHKTSASSSSGRGKLDYSQNAFEWDQELKNRMKAVFEIQDFRLCQRGVCNANLDDRDIVCIMPTGGGKSLTYQLPALFHSGCTLVISPLLSLITDQIMHLEEAGVDAVKLTGGTSKADTRDITQSLLALANGSLGSGDRNIKLCYVTPEKVAKSKTFLGILEKLAAGNKLARIVIDEAHCVSQLGHDFRPDYQKLHILRKLFPNVPIMALSATCPPKVLQDLIKTLGLKPVVDGNDASVEGTVYFTSPLYRKNLHYSVLPKPSQAARLITDMATYITQTHPNDSGIVYCLSKKDAEEVALKLNSFSNNMIKTGVYHSERSDDQKETLHAAWRRGAIKVVCATIAFGLGIDKGDVRFVLHHSLSKSVEGYYQESGRAGRDGKDADCILYYRPQDGTTLSSMVAREREGRAKLHAMLAFAQDLTECRKVQFAKYFSHTSELSMSSWTTDDSNALSSCGHCDNCTRKPEEIERQDVTIDSWKILKVLDMVQHARGDLTLFMLSKLARGSGGGAFETSTTKKGKGKEKERVSIDLGLIGGRVGMTPDKMDHLVVHLLLARYLEEKYSPTAYATIVYLQPGPMAIRLTRRLKEDLENDPSFRIECTFLKTARTRGRKALDPKDKGKKRELERSPSIDEDVNSDCEADKEMYPMDKAIELSDDDEDDDDGMADVWTYSMRPSRRPSKRLKTTTASSSKRIVREDSTDVLILSSD